MSDFTSLRRVLVLVVFALFIPSCGQPPTANISTNSNTKFAPKTAGTRGGSLAYRISAPPTTFNSLVATNEPSILIAFYMMAARPVEFEHVTQGYRAALAESWTVGVDRQKVDLKLREGLK